MPHSFISGNICFKFSVQSLCSVCANFIPLTLTGMGSKTFSQTLSASLFKKGRAAKLLWYLKIYFFIGELDPPGELAHGRDQPPLYLSPLLSQPATRVC